MSHRSRPFAAHSGNDHTTRDIKISKAMSYLLRHGGMAVGDDGFASVTAMLAAPSLRRLRATAADVRRVVEACPKQRFGLDTTGRRIRANQGHTVEVSQLELTAVTLEGIAEGRWPKDAVHGTTVDVWPAIVQSGGLCRMKRQHLHLAAAVAHGQEQAGMRQSVTLYIWLDVAAMVAAGVPVWESANGVILTEGIGEKGMVPLQFVVRAVERRTGKVLHSSEASSADSATDSTSAASPP